MPSGNVQMLDGAVGMIDALGFKGTLRTPAGRRANAISGDLCGRLYPRPT